MKYELTQGDSIIAYEGGKKSKLLKLLIEELTETSVLVQYLDQDNKPKVRMSKEYFYHSFVVTERLEESIMISISQFPETKTVIKESVVYDDIQQ